MWYLFFITLAAILLIRMPENSPGKKDKIVDSREKGAETYPLYCRKCYVCIAVCRSGAVYTDNEDIPHTDISKCVLCGNCVTACSSGARIIQND